MKLLQPMPKKYSASKDEGVIFALLISGDLSEWLKEHAWKACKRETVSRVRIPQSPHLKSTPTNFRGFFVSPVEGYVKYSLGFRCLVV